MSRPIAAIVIPAWNEWEATKACLESLRPTLGVRDEVVVVDNGSRDATAAGLRRFPWVTVVTNDENQGFARGCNQGAAAAGDGTGVVVFLNNDTLTPPHWLDGLLAPFADDPTVAATGPRSNFVSGPQLVAEAAYGQGRMSELKAFARKWRHEHRSQTTEVGRLVGFCLAVRKDAFEALSGFDEGFGIGGYEDDDLCTRLLAGGGRLLICHESYVHHEGHRTFDANGLDWYAIQQENQGRFLAKNQRFLPGAGGVSRPRVAIGSDGTPGSPGALRRTRPLLSACMIVKDEEDLLPTCLESLKGFVDEIVVYDTGSKDSTVAIAREAGANVVEGFWDDDFGRARNASLEHCTGEWVLHIDADETVVGDLTGMRDALSRAVNVDSVLVPINNVGGAEDTETSTQHIAQRIFRRERGHWIGRLHEQIWARPGQPSMRYVTEDYVELVHVGYRSDLTEQRHKTDRNLRIASVEFDELAADTPDNRRAEVLVNLGRSLNWSGRDEEALTRFEEARGLAQTIQIKTTALRSGTESLLSLGRATEALEWATELEGIVSNTDFARYLKAQAHLNLGDPDAAIACLDGITELRTAEGVAYSGGLLPLNRSLAFAAAERWPEAADALLDIPDLGSIKEAIWKPLVEAQAKAGRSLDAVAAAVPEHRLLHVAAQVIAGRAELADQLAEALWARFPDDAQVLGFGARVAPALGVARALEWSARLRAAFAERYCPLVRIASDPHRSGTDRVLAAAVASVTFAEPQARDLIRHAATAVPVETFTTMLIELDQLAPTLLDAFILGAIATRDRAEAMAQALRSLGAAEQADAVLAPLGETASAGADA